MRLNLGLLILASLTGCLFPDDGDESDGGGASCEVDDKTYPSGTRNIPAPDGCNKCTCLDGELQCTLLGCLPDDNCVEGEITHPPGGLSECVCKDGQVKCYPKCSGNPGCEEACVVDGTSYPSGTSNIPAPDGCNTCTCEGGELACTEIGCLPRAACVVNGKTYASGESGVKDPFSCNQCACDDGQLVCDDAHCPENECPPNSVPGRSCAQCGPTDACEAYEFGCMIVCENDDHCPAGTTREWCIEGVCRTLCG